MEINKKIAAGAGVALFALALMAKDPVIMTINGVDVPKSEFEYLYNKNSHQQPQQLPLDEYVEMFKLYKLKAAEARAEGLDTAAAFRKEMEQYRRDLAAPYLSDSTFLNGLVQEAYDRSLKEVEARHIMFFKKTEPGENARLRQRADSVYRALLAGADFDELARKVSQDRASAPSGGRMGYITSGQYPYAFETAVYNTPEGAIAEVVESPVGFHVIKGGKRRDARGKIQAAHILRLTQGLDPVAAAAAKEKIDSIYNVVAADPDSFEDTASKFSEDPGSARQGGLLPWFGTGQMVEEFDSVAFALKDGEISRPFRTNFGWHIVKRLDSRPVAGIEEIKPQIIARATSPQDERFKAIRANQTEKLAKRHKARVNAATLAGMNAYAAQSGLDSLFYATYASGPDGEKTLFVIEGKATPAKDFAASINGTENADTYEAQNILNDNFDAFYNAALVEAEIDRLEKEEPDYRNLLREYTDGSLLYEISVKKIWDKAAKDTDALKNYFETHRDNYKWSVPHAKGYLIQAANDSIADMVRNIAATTGRDSLVNTIRKAGKGLVVAEKVLAEKGTNAMIDNLLFDGPKAKPQRAHFKHYFMIDPRVIDQPEEYLDVRGLVTSDLQNEMQTAWEEELKAKYPVVVNRKVLKSVKTK